MGIDRFNNFILKYIDNNIIDEIDIKNKLKIIAADCIIIDINFLIYQEIIEIENEVNDIIKIILSLSSSNNNYGLIEEYLKKIFLQKHWVIYDFKDLLDGFNEDEIITKFIKPLIKSEYEMIVSHDKKGEYGHKQHIRANEISEKLSEIIKVPFKTFRERNKRTEEKEYKNKRDNLLKIYKSQKNIIRMFYNYYKN